MCGRYTVLTEDEIIKIREILKELSFRIVKDDFLEYDEMPGEVRPTDYAPIITKSKTGIAFENGKWGFKRWNSSGVIINARSETLTQNNMFSKIIDIGRCVVPAGEFFEWDKIKDGKKKYYAKDKNGNLLFMAGLYRDFESVREFVIITKEATGKIREVHDRVPVILRVDQIEPWLTGVLTPEDISALEYDVMFDLCETNEKFKQLKLF